MKNGHAVTVKVSKQLVEAMAADWSVPIQCKLEAPLPDGTYEMQCRYPSEIPDEVAAAVRERLYGIHDDDAFMDDARDVIKVAFDAWRP